MFGKGIKILLCLLLLCFGVILFEGCSAQKRGVHRAQEKMDNAEEIRLQLKVIVDELHNEEVERRFKAQTEKTQKRMVANNKKAEKFNDRYKKKCFIQKWFSRKKR